VSTCYKASGHLSNQAAKYKVKKIIGGELSEAQDCLILLTDSKMPCFIVGSYGGYSDSYSY